MDKPLQILASKDNRLPLRVGLAVLVCLGLSGCTNEGLSDLEMFVKQTKNQPKGTIPPLPEFKQYKMFDYQANGIRDPFLPVVDVEVVTKRGYTGPRPDENRIKEPLESYSLDSLRMMGSMMQGDTHWALIQDPDGLLHRLTVGNYLGLNNGKIIAMDEDRIEISELVPDGEGWEQRSAGIALSEEE